MENENPKSEKNNCSNVNRRDQNDQHGCWAPQDEEEFTREESLLLETLYY